MFLLWPFFTDDGIGDAVDALAAGPRRIVYLSAEAAVRRPGSFWAGVERAVERSAAEWVFLRPTGFAANTLMWAGQIRDSGVVRWPYGRAARSLIHERDVAAVAVNALTEDGHAGARHVLTGPQALTQVDQVEAIGDALGRELRWEELAREDAGRVLEGGVPDSALGRPRSSRRRCGRSPAGRRARFRSGRATMSPSSADGRLQASPAGID